NPLRRDRPGGAARRARARADAVRDLALQARLRLEPAGADGLHERLVVPLVLIGVCDREVGKRAVERVTPAEVRGDRDSVAGARVSPGECRAAETRVERPPSDAEPIHLGAALPVVELTHVVVARDAVQALDALPAEEDIGRRLHDPLPYNHALP